MTRGCHAVAARILVESTESRGVMFFAFSRLGSFGGARGWWREIQMIATVPPSQCQCYRNRTGKLTARPRLVVRICLCGSGTRSSSGSSDVWSKNAGFIRSSEIVISLFPLVMVTVFSPLRAILYGPEYGCVSGGLMRSSLTYTWVASCISGWIKILPFVCREAGTGRI